MTETIPERTLSESLPELLNRRRLIAAVFCTFTFDPGFFEQEVLPLLFDVELHQDAAIRKVQLEEMLREVPGRIAVYYDPRALVEGGRGPAALDVRRIPVRPRTGYFHSKNAFLLVADLVTGARSLLVLTGSANLTQSGWWENVECGHLAEVADGDRSRLREGTLSFLGHLNRLSRRYGQNRPLEEIRQFVRGLRPVVHRSAQGALHPHFLANGRPGAESLGEFLHTVLLDDFRDASLEILSPYLDDAEASDPIADLLDRFRPRRWRILLPESDEGAQCREDLFDWVTKAGGEWGRLPGALTSAGGQGARQRFVHAKVYRLFTADREVIFIGSVNLTRMAHQATGNVETGVLIEGPRRRGRPRFWLERVEERPRFLGVVSDEGEDLEPDFVPLAVRFDWGTDRAWVRWEGIAPGPHIDAAAQGVPVFSVNGLQRDAWSELPSADAHRLRDQLRATSVLTLTTQSQRGVVLVQEEGMAHRPSLLFELSPAEILRYWSLLSPAQRAAYLAERGEATTGGPEQLPAGPVGPAQDTIFDKHAGMFHGFGCLLRAASAALEDGDERKAEFHVFGAKYDSLPVMVNRLADDDSGDLLDRLLMLLCAQQIADIIRRHWPDFWEANRRSAERLRLGLAIRSRLRAELIARNDATMADFLTWYEPAFLREAAPPSNAGQVC